ncbi:MAG: cardiolipin synthase [Bacteroidaceae bacterium]|nr:cardiolipin synthase [Bacteroidaceae bacterium]
MREGQVSGGVCFLCCVCVFLLHFHVPTLYAQTAGEELRSVLLAQGNAEYEGNEITLLPSAREKFDDMFRTIREARHFVHLEYFIFRNDSVGTALIRLLHEKAREGVEVRLLIDAYGNYKAPHPMKRAQLDSIRSLGISVSLFDPIRFPYIQNLLHRDHRKIVVVDGRVAYTGGMNVADYYLHGTKRTGEWRDMQVRLEGPVVDEFERIFACIWGRVTGEALDSLRYHAPLQTEGHERMIVVNREPGRLSRQMRRAFVASLDAARERVCIVNPYPTGTRSVRRAMRRALKRGVRMEIMVSANVDNRLVPEVLGIQMKKLMKRGAEVYYYEGGFHHSKVMTVDGEFCTVGTTNIDGRSLRYDYEVNVFVFSPETTAKFDSIFRRDVSRSELLTPETFRRRFPLRRRIVGRIFQPLKGLL